MSTNQVSQSDLLSLPAELRQHIFYEILRPEEKVDFSEITDDNEQNRGSGIENNFRRLYIRLVKHSIDMQRTEISFYALELKMNYFSLYNDIQYVFELRIRENAEVLKEFRKLTAEDGLDNTNT